MAIKKVVTPTPFKVEFWTKASGRDRKHRQRYYRSVKGMVEAGGRWESRGSDFWCRYWNGLNTWVSISRTEAAKRAV